MRSDQVVIGQRWQDLQVPELGRWTPTARVGVVLPARDNQTELDKTLAALAHQTYPADLLEVVVVDDASGTPLQLPAVRPVHTRLVRREQARSHGSGAARHAGAQESDADILLFLDSDMITHPRHVEAHARWHHVTDHLLVLGHKWFVDIDDITAQAIDEAGQRGEHPGQLFEERRHLTHVWQEELVGEQQGRDVDEAFLTVVGATVSLRRSSYERCGGFSSFGLRGIVDTEFGYRAYTAGCAIALDPAAKSWHQGARNFSAQGESIKQARSGLAANHLPVPLFRQQNVGRTWAVPMVRAIVDAGGIAADDQPAVARLLLTCDAVLASEHTDLELVIGAGSGLPGWFVDYVAHDHRVSIVEQVPDTGFPSPFTLTVPPGLVLARQTIGRALGLLGDPVRMVRSLPVSSGSSLPGLMLARTRTLERLAHVGPDAGEDVCEALAGEHRVEPGALGLTTADPRITPQGMYTQW